MIKFMKNYYYYIDMRVMRCQYMTSTRYRDARDMEKI